MLQAQIEPLQTVKPAKTKMLLFLGAMVLGAALSWSTAEMLPFMLFVAVALVMAASHLRGLQTITLDRNGISQVRFWSTISWRWDDVGPFSIDRQSLRAGFFKHQVFYACAFSNQRHAVLEAHGKPMQPTYKNADILLYLQLSEAGKNVDSALEFAGQLNRMRESFARPQVSINQRDPQAAARMARAVRWKTAFFWLKCLLGAVVALPIVILLR